MTKKSLMAIIIFLTSAPLTAQTIPTTCSHSDKTPISDASLHVDFCLENNTDVLHVREELNSSPQDTLSELGFPFHIRKHESSVAEVIMVVLIIPLLIILLFSRFTKSAK